MKVATEVLEVLEVLEVAMEVLEELEVLVVERCVVHNPRNPFPERSWRCCSRTQDHHHCNSHLRHYCKCSRILPGSGRTH